MSRFETPPRKRRTREHVIADLSVDHVERFILEEGHITQNFVLDYGYDLVMMTFDAEGLAEPGLVFLQLKASDRLTRSGKNYAFELDIRDYNLWVVERFPVILVLYDASLKRALWLHIQAYFADNPFRRPKRGAKTIRVLIHPRQIVSHRAVAKWRVLKGVVTTNYA